MAWFRLDTDFFTNDEIVSLPLVTRYAVTAVIGYIKAHGGQGRAKATASQIARSVCVPEENIQEAIRTSLFSVNGKEIQVINWKDFQVDSTNSERQKRHRENKKEIVTEVTASNVTNESNASNAYRTGQDIYPPTPLKGAEEALALLIRTSDYGTNIPMNDFNLAKARQSLKDYGWNMVRAVIADVGKRAKGWGLIEAELAKQAALDQIQDESDQQAKKRVEETRNYIRSIKEKCGITE